MSPTIKKLLSALLAAVAATVISFMAKNAVPLAPALLQPLLTALLVAVAHYVDAFGSKEQALAAKKAPSIPPLPMIGLLVIAFALSGCAFFESKVPALETCAPTPAQLASQVADILLAGGDYASALEQLALKDSENAVLCAVHAFIGNPKLEASQSNTAAKARGVAYLQSKGVK